MVEDLLVAGVTASVDEKGRLYFWGEVFNLGGLTQRWVRVTVRLLSEGDEVLAEQADILGLEWTLPGAYNPFHIRFQNPPQKWHHYDIFLTSQVHDYQDQSVPQPHLGLIAEKLHYREIGRADLRCGIIGLLTNASSQPATHVKAAATLYDPEGNVTGVLSPYLVPRGLFAPGDSLPFELKFYAVGGEVANYTVQVQGRVLTPNV